MVMKHRQYIVFLVVGLLLGGFGEAINHLFIMGTPGGFFFALGFYAVTLSIAYQLFYRFVRGYGIARWWMYVFGTGIGFGLLINEWLLIGHHPFNPSTSAFISQFSMIAFHSILYTVPALTMLTNSDVQHFLRRFALISILFGMLVLVVVSTRVDADEVLGWGVLLTYFIGYSGLYIWLLIWSWRNISSVANPERI